jgi:3-methylcrotonyl-CoA carboxylase alpha subunit
VRRPSAAGLRSVLIANRGEIAVRVIRTCRRMGIRTVAVYSDADARALHVLEADEAYRIGRAPAAESYLRQEALLEVALRSGVQAVHPGYGFLAESERFAQACLDAGLRWVGPSPAAMRALGDKASAKALAERTGVPVLPGYHGPQQEPAFLAARAAEIGYPILIKASAGGGGRGMRVVDRPSGLEDQLEAARREAVGAFGDGRLLLERFVRRPRHVEVQILGDSLGNLVWLGERECSVQRRHQKLVEETPSPAVDDLLRAEMGEAALRLARAAGYANAGTVEFLLDEEGRFSFLEVNARLQVEHPVTELVTGQDLVALQLAVAAGDPLPFRQEDVRLEGHAIEARLIAEDPAAGFLPSTGRLEAFAPPAGPGIRNDVGVYPGAEVSRHYDSLLAKLVVHTEDRPGAVELLRRALQRYVVEGVRTNLDLLLALTEDADFRAGRLHTGFLAERRVIERMAEVPGPAVAAAAAAEFVARSRPEDVGLDPWRGPAAWRPGRLDQPSEWVAGEQVRRVRVTQEVGRAQLRVVVDGNELAVEPLGERSVRVGHDVALVWDAGWDRLVVWRGRTHRLRRRPPPRPEEVARDRAGEATGALVAPMPGLIVKVDVREGERVVANQPLLVLEAMKMEHVIEAPHDGLVRRLHVEPGDQVAGGAPLVEIGGAEDSARACDGPAGG